MNEVELVNQGTDEPNEKESFSPSSSKEDYLSKALTFQSLNDNRQALEWFDQSLRIDPNYTEALIGKGNSYLRLGNNEEALVSFKKALKLNDQYPLDIKDNSKKGCANTCKGFNKKITISFIFLIIILIIIILILIREKVKLNYHYMRKKNTSWIVTGGIISYLLNERNPKEKRLFLIKGDIIEETNKKNQIHIALAFDSNFIYPPLVLMTSILENNNKDKNLVVLHLLLPEDFDVTKMNIIETLRNKYEVKINYYFIPNIFNVYQKWGETYTIYYKMLLPMMFPDLDRIIYLDSDVLVFKDLLEMYNLPFNDNYVLGYPSHDAKYIDKLADNVKAYVNGGVLMFNIKKLRKENKDIELIQYTFDKNEYLSFLEQCAMNVVFLPKVGILPLKYGVLLYDIDVYDNKLKSRIRVKIDRDELKNAIEDPAIIHFSLCTPKVWYTNSKNFYGRDYICKRYHDLFYYYAQKTEFYSEIRKKFIG